MLDSVSVRFKNARVENSPLHIRIQFRDGQSTVGGPKWTKMAKWTKMVHFGLANAKIQFGIRPFCPKWSFGPFWTILVQYTFRQYRGHSLTVECRNRLRVGVRAKNAGLSGFACRPF